MKKIIVLSVGIVYGCIFTACTSDQHVYKTEELIELSDEFEKIATTTTDDNLTVEMYQNTSTIEMGYNPLYFRVLHDDEHAVVEENLNVIPYMGMGKSGHGAPVLPVNFDKNNQLYQAGIVFNMPGEWEISAVLAEKDTANFELYVASSEGRENLIELSYGKDEKYYSVALTQPSTWEIGENNFSIVVNEQKNNMIDFPEANGFDIHFTTSFIDSVKTKHDKGVLQFTENGLYTGKTNVDKEGIWELDFTILQENDTLVKSCKLAIEL